MRKCAFRAVLVGVAALPFASCRDLRPPPPEVSMQQTAASMTQLPAESLARPLADSVVSSPHAPSMQLRGDNPSRGSGDEAAGTLAFVRQFGDSLTFASISFIQPIGAYLLIADRLSDPHLMLMDRASGRIVSRFGRHGQGPAEYGDPAWSLVVSESPPQAWVYDFKNRRFSLLQLDLPPEAMVFDQMVLNSSPTLESPTWVGNRLISNGLFPDYTLLVMDREGKPALEIKGDPPFTEREIAHPVGRFMLNRNWMAVDPSRRRIAVAYQFKSRIDFFTADGTRYASVQGPRRATARFRVEGSRFFWDDKNEMAYQSVTATDRYVYALYCGCAKGEDAAPTLLHVFDWNGEFVGEYPFDRGVRNIHVSGDDSLIYATFESLYPYVGEWRLPVKLNRP